jgi:hypothetical protein
VTACFILLRLYLSLSLFEQGGRRENVVTGKEWGDELENGTISVAGIYIVDV